MTTILDGGMGQELLARSGATPTYLWSTQVMMDTPHFVREIHDAYFAAGAQIATTNTYAILRDRLEHAGIPEQFEALHRQACEIARAARDAHGSGRVAGSLGPLKASYRPDLTPPLAEAAEVYAEIVALHAPLVDLHIIETVSSVDAARGALAGCARSDKPVWLAVSVDDEDGTRLRSGEPVAEVLKLTGYAALLVNCSRPEAVSTALGMLSGAKVPTGAYANGFVEISAGFKQDAPTADALSARQDLDPAAYLAHARDWADQGATIIGGCCEVGPNHIRALADHFQGVPA